MLGRETCLQKVRWSPDGWLRLAYDGALSGGGAIPRGEGTPPPGTLPQIIVPAPSGVAPHPWPATPTGDDFAAPQLDPSWSALRGPVDGSWASLTARPGWLRLRGRESLHSLFCQSLVAQRLTEHRTTARTCLEFRPEHFTQSAGLVCYYDTRTHFYLRVTHDEARGRVLGVVWTDDGSYGEAAGAGLEVNDWPAFHLQAEIDGARLQFSASRDGGTWQPVGPALDASKLSDDYGAGLHFTGAFVGLCAQDLGGAGISADFARCTFSAGVRGGVEN